MERGHALLEALPRSAVSLGMSLKIDVMRRIGHIEKHFNHISRGLDGKAAPAATQENLQFSYDHNALLRKKSDERIWILWDAPFMQGHNDASYGDLEATVLDGAHC